MAVNFESLQGQVMKLSKAERIRLLERLVASLESDVDIEEYWDTVAEARDTEIDAGRSEGVPLEEAMARLRAKFPG
jgi:putative addiction module component (TIGR02574 family)